MRIRELNPSDTPWVESVVTEQFGSPSVVSRGVLHDARELGGLVAEVNSKPVGLLQYHWDNDQCEIVVLISEIRREGIGRALLKAAQAKARQAGCDRLWLITTNNNRVALEFYQAIGWNLVAIHRGAVREARKLKPEIPEVDEDGIAIEDEIEFELRINSG
ncbi:MAG: GNAT family N-acetyltransferase [Anaerolineales bacterium]